MSFPDPIGLACEEYWRRKKATKILVKSSIPEHSVIEASLFFRTFARMPKLEKMALSACRGSVLDLGGGVGSHGLYLQRKKFEVCLLDISERCCQIATERGVKKVFNQDFRRSLPGKYKTILMMMNGIGVCGTLVGLKAFLKKVKKNLQPGGCILFDSCDILFAYEQKNSAILLEVNRKYYGELIYETSYKKIKSEPFPWLFIGVDKMREIAEKMNYRFQVLHQQKDGRYLGRLFEN
jgi:SAM-dependent methyltransferase